MQDGLPFANDTEERPTSTWPAVTRQAGASFYERSQEHGVSCTRCRGYCRSVTLAAGETRPPWALCDSHGCRRQRRVAALIWLSPCWEVMLVMLH